MSAPLVVPARFNGPPRSGNGGWTCGALAARLRPGPGEAVQVRLSAPPPLDVPLEVTTEDDGSVLALDAGRPVARAVRVASPFTDPAPALVTWDVAVAAEPGYRGWSDHPFPTCFSCGTARPASDGLALRPGPLPGQDDVTACTWTPDASLADPDDAGRVSAEVTWAALDCPGGWSVDLAGRPMVLGTMTAALDGRPEVGRPHVVVGRVLRLEGRKAWTETALHALDDGRLLGRASAVWIAVDPAAVAPV
ncbi:hypothetical protein GCM10027446_09370 [Angustibacter peucedani]